VNKKLMIVSVACVIALILGGFNNTILYGIEYLTSKQGYSYVVGEAVDWWDCEWSYSKKITIDHTKITSDQFYYPVLLSQSSDADLALYAQSTGGDIVFVDSFNSTQYAHELELFDESTGEMAAWVNIPSLSSTSDTILYMYYGNADCGPQWNNSGTWNSGFAMVHHLKETSSPVYDSTSNELDGTTQGSMSLDAVGKIGSGAYFEGLEGHIDFGSHTSLNITGSLTVEAWVKDPPIHQVGSYPLSPSVQQRSVEVSLGGVEILDKKTEQKTVSPAEVFQTQRTVISKNNDDIVFAVLCSPGVSVVDILVDSVSVYDECYTASQAYTKQEKTIEEIRINLSDSISDLTTIYYTHPFTGCSQGVVFTVVASMNRQEILVDSGRMSYLVMDSDGGYDVEYTTHVTVLTSDPWWSPMPFLRSVYRFIFGENTKEEKYKPLGGDDIIKDDGNIFPAQMHTVTSLVSRPVDIQIDEKGIRLSNNDYLDLTLSFQDVLIPNALQDDVDVTVKSFRNDRAADQFSINSDFVFNSFQKHDSVIPAGLVGKQLSSDVVLEFNNKNSGRDEIFYGGIILDDVMLNITVMSHYNHFVVNYSFNSNGITTFLEDVYSGEKPELLPVDFQINKYDDPLHPGIVDRARLQYDNRYGEAHSVDVTVAYPAGKKLLAFEANTNFTEYDTHLYDDVVAGAGGIGETGTLLASTEGYMLRSYHVSVPADSINMFSFKIPSVYGEFNNLHMWLTGSFAGGAGTSGDPYQISNWTHLNSVRNNLTESFILTANLDSSTDGYDTYASSSANSGSGWLPLGDSSTKFTGSFDGDNHTISDLYINRSISTFIGLFGYTDGASISNVGVVNANVTGKDYVGGLVGFVYFSSSVNNSYIINSTVSGNKYVGCLAGYVYTSSVNNSYTINSTVSGDERVGGLIGYVYTSSVNNSYTINSTVSGDESVGGLAGYVRSSSITNSYTINSTVSGNNYVGGLAGYVIFSSSVDNSYTSGGTVTRSFGTNSNFGGFVGYNYRSSITNCYSTNSVHYTGAADPTDKGFAGSVDTGDGYAMSGNFWDTETSGQTSTSGDATGKTTAQMKTFSTFDNAGWDISYTTIDLNDGYPYLAWQNNTDTNTWLILKQTYTVTFDEQGGTTPSPSSKSVTLGEQYATLATTTKIGYIFGEWNTQADGDGDTITAATTVTTADNHTLYAQWTVDVPDVPSSFTATMINSEQINLSWVKGNKADYTMIQRKTGSYPTSISDGTNVYNNTGTEHADSDSLAEGTTYYYRAWSWNATDSVWSTSNASVSNTTNNLPTVSDEGPSNESTGISLTPELNITVNDADGHSMTITWYSNSSGSWQVFGTNSTVGNGTYHQINSNFSDYSTTYYWNVSVSDGIDTNISDIFHFTTEAITAPSVSTLDATGITATNATLQGYLDDDGGEACTVRFEYGTNTSYGTNTTNQIKTSTGSFSHNIIGLTPGQLYRYQTFANNTVGNTTGEDKAFLTKPQTTTNFTATQYSETQINLTWTKAVGANNTYIERHSTPTWSKGEGTLIYNDTGTSFQDTQLYPGQNYYYKAWSVTIWTYNPTLYQYSESSANSSTETIYANKNIISKTTQAYSLEINQNATILYGTIKNTTISASITTDWHHVALTYDGSTMRLYRDGSLVNSTSLSGSIPTNTQPAIAGQYLTGWLDEIRISHTTRSSTWIDITYQNTNDPESFASFGSQQGVLSTWTYRKLLTINHSITNETLEDFPLLVHTQTDSNLVDNAELTGYDILFMPTNEPWVQGTWKNKLDYEIENYNPSTGELTVWVRLPRLSSTENTQLYMYYGNSLCTTNKQNPEGVWNEQYVARYSMKDYTTSSIQDSTSNSNHGTKNSSDEPNQTTGKIGYAQQFDGIDDYINIDDSSEMRIGTSDFTISLWVNINQLGQRNILLSKGSPNQEEGSWQFEVNDDNTLRFAFGAGTSWDNGSTTVVAQGWQQVVISVERTNEIKYYIDGDNAGIISSPNYNLNTTNLTIFGMNRDKVTFLNATIDELRISNTARNASWINASYNNQNNTAAYVNFGPQRTKNTPPVQKNPQPEHQAVGIDIAPNLTIIITDKDADAVNITFKTNASGSWQNIGTNNSVYNGTYLQQATMMNQHNTTYYWSVNATDGIDWTNATYQFSTIAAQTYYFNNYDNSNTTWNDINDLIDGQTNTYAFTNQSNQSYHLNATTFTSIPTSQIQKVEIRIYAYYENETHAASLYLQPIYNNSDGSEQHISLPANTASWSNWIDITTGLNAPNTWDEQYLLNGNLTCKIRSYIPDQIGEPTIYASKVELKISYMP
jgi:hypothetical protein